MPLWGEHCAADKAAETAGLGLGSLPAVSERDSLVSTAGRGCFMWAIFLGFGPIFGLVELGLITMWAVSDRVLRWRTCRNPPRANWLNCRRAARCLSRDR